MNDITEYLIFRDFILPLMMLGFVILIMLIAFIIEKIAEVSEKRRKKNGRRNKNIYRQNE